MKIVDTPTLKRLLGNAYARRLNKLLPMDLIPRLDPHGNHVLAQPMLHNDREIRCFQVMLKVTGDDEPVETTLDFTIEDFNQLPEHGDQN